MDIRVSLFDDNAAIRESLGELLRYTSGIVLTSVNADATQVLQVVASERPDVILMDIDMPGFSGIEATRRLHAATTQVQVIMLTVFEDEERVYQALQAGAMGYLLKSTPPKELLTAIAEVHEGGAPMTPSIARKVLAQLRISSPARAMLVPDHQLGQREQEVLQCLVDGLSYKMVADKLGISINTVRSHIKHIYEKLHVRSNTEAVAKTINERLLG